MVKWDGAALSVREAGKIATAARLDEAGSQLRHATSASNAQILTGIRDIVRMQINQLTAASARGETFDGKQASTLLKLAQTFAILDSKTVQEQAKYDMSGESTPELAAAEAAARRLLGTE